MAIPSEKQLAKMYAGRLAMYQKKRDAFIGPREDPIAKYKRHNRKKNQSYYTRVLADRVKAQREQYKDNPAENPMNISTKNWRQQHKNRVHDYKEKVRLAEAELRSSALRLGITVGTLKRNRKRLGKIGKKLFPITMTPIKPKPGMSKVDVIIQEANEDARLERIARDEELKQYKNKPKWEPKRRFG